jgi:uncharacterized protein YbjT (DUF2867 family)
MTGRTQSPAGRLVFLTGGTGYIGGPLVPALTGRGHEVRALVRAGTQGTVPEGCTIVGGSALDRSSYGARVAPCDTFVHLVGVAHPSPSKAREFREIDFVAAREAVLAAGEAGVRHFVYVSVAHPAPLMREFIRVRTECEALIASSGLPATILRPWYVTGPGHRWASVLTPLYLLAERFPLTRATALRLGLVSLDQMVRALLWSVEHPPQKTRILGVPEIRTGKAAS